MKDIFMRKRKRPDAPKHEMVCYVIKLRLTLGFVLDTYYYKYAL